MSASPSTKRQYTVTAEIVGSERATVRWYRGDNLGKALAALVGAAAHTEDVDDSNIPESVRYHTTSVHMDIEEVEDEPVQHVAPEPRKCRVCGSPLDAVGFCTMPKEADMDHCPMNETVQ